MHSNVQPNRRTAPRWARWLLTRLHPEETLEEVEGDLDELYAYWYQRGPTGRTGKTQCHSALPAQCTIGTAAVCATAETERR